MAHGAVGGLGSEQAGGQTVRDKTRAEQEPEW
jgi:hypothetical protein